MSARKNIQDAKICKRCLVPKPISCFRNDDRYADGLDSWCKECHAEVNREWHKAHKEEHNAINRKWSDSHPDLARISARQSYAKKNGAKEKFTLEQWNDLVLSCGNRCAYCNTLQNFLEPDHIVPLSQGGSNSIENIVPVCGSCNSSKNNRPLLVWLYQRARR